MENFCLTKKILQLAIFFIFLTQHSIAQKEETDRVLTKKRGEDAWFLENSAWPPMPYDFGYEVRDLEGNEQYRNEQSDGNRVVGSYGYFGSDGIYRHVDYIADALGFRASVRTSEPGVAAQNPANVKIITEPLLPQRTPVPGGRILRPVETPGVFDPSIITDPVIQKGLTYIPNAGGSRGRGTDNSRGTGSNSDEDDVPTSSVRGRPNTSTSTRGGAGSSSRVPASGSPTGSSLSGSGRPPSPYAREIAAGRDPSIITRDPSAFNGIDDILGIGGRGITIPIERPKPVQVPSSMMNPSSKTREDDGPNVISNTRTRGGSSSTMNADSIDDLLRNRKILERERELAAREQSLLERERNANRIRNNAGASSGVKGGGSYRQISIPSHEFKRRDSSSSLNKQQQNEMSDDASTIDKEPADSSELVKKNGSSGSSAESSANKDDNGSSLGGNSKVEPVDSGVNAIESMLMNNNKGPVKVYLSMDGPTTMKMGSGSDGQKQTAVAGSVASDDSTIKREREATIIRGTNSGVGGMKDNGETSTRKSFESTDQQISHLKFDDETDRIAKYVLKPQRNALYAHTLNHQYPPVDKQSSSSGAIQLKRSYPKNYQQYRLLRSRLPRERPSIKASSSSKELTSTSSKGSKVQNGKLTKEASNEDKQKMGGERLLNSVLSNKLISLKDNEQSSSIKTDHRINFRSDLLPRVNLAYNLIKRTGLASNDNEQLVNQLYIQKYSNQTKNSNRTSNLKDLNDAILLTNVNLNRNAQESNLNNSSLINNTFLSSASSIREILFPILDQAAASLNSTDDLKIKKLTESTVENKNLKLEQLSTTTTTSTESSIDFLDDDNQDNQENSRSPSNNNELKIFKSFSMLSPHDLKLIKLTPTMIANSNRI